MRYMRLKSIKGSKRAIVAVARLIIRLRSVLLYNVPFRMTKSYEI